MYNPVENAKLVVLQPPTTTNAAITATDYVSLKNVHMCYIIAQFKQAATHATALSLLEATTVAGGSAGATTVAVPVWKNADISSTDTLVRGTDAANIACTAGTTDQLLVMQFDPAKFSAGFDCLAAAVAASSESTNFVSIVALLVMRYQEDVPPSAILD